MPFEHIQRRTARRAASLVPAHVSEWLALRGDRAARRLPSYPEFAAAMSRYRVERLVGVEPSAFEGRIRGYLAVNDPAVEGFEDPSKQRDLSIRFHWGHDHDFGTFALQGLMGDRHLTLLARFRDRFGALPRSLQGRRVLDIGCWTGGASLVMAAMGAQVVAVEEVRKYVDCLWYLKDAFAIEGLEPRAMSLYGCTGPEFQDAFDLVLFAGVLYHVTDPILALRLTFDALKDGGRCLVETAISRSRGIVMAYEGPTATCGGSADELTRAGWNWYLPSVGALAQMMSDVGYQIVRTERAPGSRAFAVGQRTKHVDMLRAGLSVKDVR